MKPALALRTAVALATAFLFFTAALSSCKKKGPIPFDPAFAQYISAFTSGSISTASNIRIRLTDAFVENIQTESPITDKLLDFSPSIEGDLYWLDNQTLEFRPKQWLPRGKAYEATLRMDKIVQVPSNLSRFKFGFIVMNQHLDVSVSSIKPYHANELEWMQMSGSLSTIDVCDEAGLPKTIKATEGGRDLQVHWLAGNQPYVHYFTVDSIQRGNAAQTLKLTWDGSALDTDQKGEKETEIPALGDFKVFSHSIVQQPEQYVQLLFSDPLLANQNLEGLIDFTDIAGERFTIEGNEVRVYPPNRIVGSHQLLVHTGIKNSAGAASTNEQSYDLLFEDLKPEVKINDPQRVILPSTDGLVFPFEAVNLSAVDVRVIRIFENNVPQFLQVSDLDGDNQMRRVGRVVKKKTVQLNPDGNKDLAVWNNFFLDLDKIIKTEPGAIYRVEIGFRKAYSLYPCTDSGEEADEENMQDISVSIDEEKSFEESDDSYWDEDGEYGGYDDKYYEYYDYDYSERDDPCSNTYYSYRDPVAKNILASDLGLIAKKGQDNSLLFAVSDIKTTKPMSGVECEVLNFQQQPIAKGTTNGDGLLKLEKLKGVPFLLVAKQGKQRGYLKLDGGHALSLSMFDVSGQETQKGLKGFIYGERGVWRPGDRLFLNFVLEDEKKTLPAIHPVHFELINARGQVVQKMVRSKSENGFFAFKCKTDADAETGNYQAVVRVGGAVFSKTVKIETIKPNRLKLKLDFGDENLKALNSDMQGTLNVKWLHGAVAKNLKANVSATFTQSWAAFEKFKEFNFNDPVRNFNAEEQVVFDNYVNAEGNAIINLKTNFSNRAPGMLNANFSVKVFEEGGDFSVDRFSMPYAPYKNFVGIKVPEPEDRYNYALDTDKDHQVQVATVNAQGQPTGVDSLVWKVYKVQWRWWWERSGNDLASYVGSESTTPVASGMLRTNADGKGQFILRVNEPEWGRYLIRIEDMRGGHATGQTVYMDWPNGENRAKRSNEEGANVLTFSMDKEKYTVGEKCTVTFPSSDVGRAFVSIESSTGVILTQWVESRKGQTTFSFTTNEQMTPNAYVYISLLQPHSQTANDLPIRLYGVMPLFVENPGSHLQPIIQMQDELLPEKAFDINVSEKEGKAMTYTLAVVDEGLLDLTRFKTPDPWNHFYAREALGVNTYDMYDQVIGAFGAKLEKLLSLGGDGEAGGKGKNRANRFKPVVMHLGPFTVEAGKTKTHHLTMPNYIGSVRVMVVAGKNMAYGNAEKTVPVKKPLMVLASLPRVVGPGEEVKLPVTVFAMDPKIKNVDVKVEANEFFQMLEGNSKTIQFAEMGDDVVNFPVRIAERVGVGKVKVTVSSGSFSSTYEVELDVRNPNPFNTNALEAIVEKGQSWTGTFDLPGMAGTNTSLLEISSIPSVDFGRRLKYLLEYPHGCIEQTTSSVFPQLYLSDVIEMTDAEKNKAIENVKAGINRLAKFQVRSGGMSYWPGDSYEDGWGSSYAGHFMLEAKNKGFTLPQNWETLWVSYQQREAQNWQPQLANSGYYYWRESDLMQAYRLYTLALAGKAEMGAMNRLKEFKDISLAARWRLAAAYALAGRKEDAAALVNGYSTTINPYTSLSYTYGNNTRDEAMIVETLVTMGERVKAAPLAKELAKNLSSTSWYSTQTVAYGLLAMSKFAMGEQGSSISYSYTLNGKSVSNKNTNKPIAKENLGVQQLKGNQIVLKNDGNNLLYVKVITTGQPANGNEMAANNNLFLVVTYTDMKGTAINVNQLEQGTDFLAEVRCWNPGVRGRLDELALTQIFPSGWEIINNRMDASAAVMNANQPDYSDVRDDRVYSYFDLNPNETKFFRIKLNASYLGKFYLPATNCEAMYDNTINSRTTGQWVEVVPLGGPQASR